MKRCSRLDFLPVLSLLFCCCIPAAAIEVGWHDNMYLQLGDGVRLNRQKEPASLGLVLLSNPTTTNNLNTGSWVKTVTFAQHTYDMIKTLSVNGSVSLDADIFAGDVNVGFFGKQTFDANDLIFVYTGVKDFGTTVYSPVDFSPTNKALIAGYQNSLRGAGLHSAISGALGTHYVRGYDSAAMVSVVYTFHYDSSSIRQQTVVGASGVSDVGSFSSFVSSFFGSTNTDTSMSYQFYSTDPYQLTTNLNFAAVGVITNYQQFTNFLNEVDNYGNAMSQAHAKVTAYILDPIQTVPGYLSMLGGYVPPPVGTNDYNTFLQDYTALQAAKQNLDSWLLGGNMLSWLNAQGRQVSLAQWNQVNNYLAAMKTLAVNHFTTGAPLNVPVGAANFVSGFFQIRLPKFIVLNSLTSGSDRYIIGRVDCGSTNWTTPAPFFGVTALYHHTNYYGGNQDSLFPIYYNGMDFQTNELANYSSGTIKTALTNLFASDLWHCLTNAHPDVNGFFVVQQPSNQAANWSIEIDTINAVGATVPVDEMGLLSPTDITTGCILPAQISTPLNE